MPILAKLREFLDANGVRYEVRSHPEALTANAVVQAEHLTPQQMAKVVIVRSGAEYLMAVLAATRRLDLHRLRRLTELPDLHLATEEEFAKLFPQCEPGAMPPFGNLFGLPVWMDDSLAAQKEIVFNAGNHRQTVHMPLADFARLVKPEPAAFGKVEGE
jgi:Ala-tRNA(Pro) deacylase